MSAQPVRQVRSATKGLATVALLKVNFDAGHDHIGMFVPFVLDAVSILGGEGFGIDEVRAALEHRSQLSIPTNTLRTLITRVVKRGFVQREGGLYFLTGKKIEVDDLVAGRLKIEERQRRLAGELCEFAKQRGLSLTTTEDALAAILGFIEDHHVPLALADSIEAQTPVANEDAQVRAKRTLVVAAFLQDQIAAEGEPAAVIQEMLEGFVLQNALLLKDISTAARRFNNLGVYLDTRLLLGALGFRGPATELATREAFSLLREGGAILAVFDTTIREVRRILAVYEQKLGTAEGRLSLRPNDVTRYFLTNHYSPSEVVTQSALVERNLRGLGINVRDLPKHQAPFTLDERDLSNRLSDRSGGESDPRVVHDVECIAGILTLRAGRQWDSLDNARAVFATTSGLLVRNASDWYDAQGGRGVPPIIHHLTLSNIAWLKRPASASKLKLHELVALCGAALRPSRKAWDSFLWHLKRLQASGSLSSDEVTAIVVSALTDKVLGEESADDDVDAVTVSEVVERVKATYRLAADERVASAELAAKASEKRALELRTNLERRARGLARTACWIFTAILVICLLGGLVATIQGIRSGETPAPLGSALASALAAAGLMSVLWGFNLRGWRQSLEEQLTKKLKRWIAGE